MSVITKLTPEQLATFEGCETKEEVQAKAQELGVACTETDLIDILDAIDKELSDDEIDAVAGGKEEKDRGDYKDYRRVWRRDDCSCGQWQAAGVPAFPGVKKIGKCGNCEWGRTINKKLVCIFHSCSVNITECKKV